LISESLLLRLSGTSIDLPIISPQSPLKEDGAKLQEPVGQDEEPKSQHSQAIGEQVPPKAPMVAPLRKMMTAGMPNAKSEKNTLMLFVTT
jgi:hypothetical protein